MAKREHYATVGNIIKESFALYGRGASVIIPLSALLYIPFFYIFNRMMTPFFNASLTYGDPFGSGAMNPTHFWLWYAASMIYMGLGSLIVGYISIRRLCNDYLETSETLGEMGKGAVNRFFSLFWVSILMSLGIIGGCLLLYVPGIILMLAWSIYLPVFTAEGLKGRAVLRRSRELTKGFKGEIFGTGILLVLMLYLFVLILAALAFFIFKDRVMYWIRNTDGNLPSRFWTGYMTVIGGLSILLAPFYYTVPTAFYFNLIKEKEGPGHRMEHLFCKGSPPDWVRSSKPIKGPDGTEHGTIL